MIHVKFSCVTTLHSGCYDFVLKSTKYRESHKYSTKKEPSPSHTPVVAILSMVTASTLLSNRWVWVGQQPQDATLDAFCLGNRCVSWGMVVYLYSLPLSSWDFPPSVTGQLPRQTFSTSLCWLVLQESESWQEMVPSKQGLHKPYPVVWTAAFRNQLSLNETVLGGLFPSQSICHGGYVELCLYRRYSQEEV